MTAKEQEEHAGGSAAPPIAGDPDSFASDAEIARTLAATIGRATLGTLTSDGFPYGSAVSHAVADADGAPLLLISELAEHTVNAHHDPRASLLVSADTPEGADPLSTARLTLLGTLHAVESGEGGRDTYLRAHPYARYYADFPDFSFWRLEVARCRFVGGFGKMSWVDAAAYGAAKVDPVAPSAPDIITHMNGDHGDANLVYVRVLGGLSEATAATLTGVDRYGMTLQTTTPSGPRLARVAFPQPLNSADEVRAASIDLLQRARNAR